MDSIMRVPVTAAVFAAMAVLLSGCMAYNAASVEHGRWRQRHRQRQRRRSMRTSPGHVAAPQRPLEVILSVRGFRRTPKRCPPFPSQALADFARVRPQEGIGRLSPIRVSGTVALPSARAAFTSSIAALKRLLPGSSVRRSAHCSGYIHGRTRSACRRAGVISLDRLVHIVCGSPSNSRPQPRVNSVSPEKALPSITKVMAPRVWAGTSST